MFTHMSHAKVPSGASFGTVRLSSPATLVVGGMLVPLRVHCSVQPEGRGERVEKESQTVTELLKVLLTFKATVHVSPHSKSSQSNTVLFMYSVPSR